MRVFDFDGTLYRGDSTRDFWIYTIRKIPRSLFALPIQLSGALAFQFGLLDRDAFKERFYAFLPRIPSIEDVVASFWNDHEGRLRADMLAHLRSRDLIVSASPSFLLTPLCKKLGANLIASEVDPMTGRLLSKNCRGEEKVRRIYEEGYALPFEEAYSDSLADAPLLGLALRSYLVSREGIRSFDSSKQSF